MDKPTHHTASKLELPSLSPFLAKLTDARRTTSDPEVEKTLSDAINWMMAAQGIIMEYDREEDEHADTEWLAHFKYFSRSLCRSAIYLNDKAYRHEAKSNLIMFGRILQLLEVANDLGFQAGVETKRVNDVYMATSVTYMGSTYLLVPKEAGATC